MVLLTNKLHSKTRIVYLYNNKFSYMSHIYIHIKKSKIFTSSSILQFAKFSRVKPNRNINMSEIGPA